MSHPFASGADHARKPPATGATVVKRVVLLLTLAILTAVAAVSVSVADPNPARAAGGGYVAKCGEGTIFLNEKERKAFVLHNQIRRDRDLRPFCVHPKLQKAARAHSQDMIERDYFSHDTKGGATFEERMKKFGYTPDGYGYYSVGENIAYGSGTFGEPDSIMRGWMNSDGHRHNILNGRFREVGIGTYTGTWQGHDGVSMYTADFGTRQR